MINNWKTLHKTDVEEIYRNVVTNELLKIIKVNGFSDVTIMHKRENGDIFIKRNTDYMDAAYYRACQLHKDGEYTDNWVEESHKKVSEIIGKEDYELNDLLYAFARISSPEQTKSLIETIGKL